MQAPADFGDRDRPIDLSIVVPMYNEEENAADTVRRIAETMEPLGRSWELVLVDDGSADSTPVVLEQLALTHPFVRYASYRPNRGRGHALRTGFAMARGRYVIATDADLTYDPAYMLEMIRLLDGGETDMVLASPYMPGGRAENVPAHRLLISRIGNRILSATLPAKIYTITCVFRAYRRQVLDSMILESDGKELHLEILSKALTLGYRVKEIPAVLTGRRKGKSSFRFRRTTLSHLLFSFSERPMLLFGLLGVAMFLGGLAIGIYMFVLYAEARLNPTRPFMVIMAILLMSGLFMFSFGFVTINISLLRKELYRIQKQNILLQRLVDRLSNSSERKGKPL